MATRTILLVENNKSDARKIGQSLRDLGYEVTLATDGQEGMELFTASPPDLAVIDMLLPKVSGSELCLRLREKPEGEHVPLVLISSIFKNMNLARIAQDRWKVDHFFEKPLDLDAFGRAVDELVEESVARRGPAPQAEAPAPSLATEDALETALTEFEGEAIEKVDPAPVVPPAEPVEALRSIDSPTAAGSGEIDDEIQAPDEPAAQYRTVERRQEFHLKEIPLAGDLEENSVPEILAFLYYHEESGVLEVCSQEARKKVYVQAGNPVYVESVIREESLGRMLVREGVISEEDCFLSLQNMRTYRKQQGGALVQAGLLTPLQLMDALRRQIRRKVVNLFAWFTGEYEFNRKRIKSDRVATFEMAVPELIVEGIREYYDPATIGTIFEEIRQLRLRAKGYVPFQLADVGLSIEERALIDLADGTRSIERIVHDSPIDQASTFQLLYALMLLGVFEGIIEEQELVDDEATARPAFPDIEFLEEQAEAAARGLEEMTMGDRDSATIEFDESAVAADDDELEPIPISFEPEADEPPQANAAPVLVPEPPADTPAASGEPDAAIDFVPVELDEEFEADEAESLDMLDDPESEAFADLSPEDRELRDRIVADFLALGEMNHYDVMGVSRDAATDLVKSKYLALAKTYHADTLGEKFDPGIVQKANEVFSRVTVAYKTLLDPEKRAKYDKILTETGEERKERSVHNILVAENHFNRGADLLRREVWGRRRRRVPQGDRPVPGGVGVPQPPRVVCLPHTRDRRGQAVRGRPRNDPEGDLAEPEVGRGVLLPGPASEGPRERRAGAPGVRPGDPLQPEERRGQGRAQVAAIPAAQGPPGAARTAGKTADVPEKNPDRRRGPGDREKERPQDLLVVKATRARPVTAVART